MLPWAIRRRSASGVMSTSSSWSAARTTASGTVSRCLTPVICSTTSLSDSRCWMLTVEITSMPASSSSSMSWHRFALREPGTLVWASSSTSTRRGCRARMASTSISSNVAPRYSRVFRGMTSSPSTCSAVCARPCVSTNPTTTSVPRSTARRPSLSMAYVLPTPGAAPRSIRSVPRAIVAMFPGEGSCRGRLGVRGEGGADLIGESDRDDPPLEAHRHPRGRQQEVPAVRLAATLHFESHASAWQTEAADAPPHAPVDDVAVALQLGDDRTFEPSEPRLEPATPQLEQAQQLVRHRGHGELARLARGHQLGDGMDAADLAAARGG